MSNPDDVTVTFTSEQAKALADHPATLHPSDEGTFWVNTVKEAVAVLNAARERGADPPVPPNPPEHPAESARSDGPITSLQSIIDVHIDALAEQFQARGKSPLCVAIIVRLAEEADSAGNDTIAGYGFPDGTDTEDAQGQAILATLTRTLRAARRVFAPELR